MDLTRNAAVRALAGACALTLLVAACGGDDEDTADVVDDTETTEAAADDDTTTSTEAEDDETTTTAADDDTTTTEAEEPDDSGDGSGDGTEGDPDAVALAQRVNLTIDDFDETWTETPPDDDDGGQNIDDCFVGTDIEAATVGEAETGSFSDEPSDEAVQIVTMQTVILDGLDTAEAVVAEFSDEAFTTCVADVMRDGFGDDAEASLALRPDDPAWTEESTGLVGDLTIPNGDGTPLSGVVDLHVFRTAEVVSFTATVDVGVGIEPLLGEVYATVAERHATEVG
jgi:hypothetical protein